MQDVQGTLDDKKSKVIGGKETSERAETRDQTKTPTAADAADGGQWRPESAKASLKLSSVIDSPCMAKSDLKEFVVSQSNAMEHVLSLNAEDKGETGRKDYKWPMKTIGSQVGASLTDLTTREFGIGQTPCSAKFRVDK